jgi:hypothetical protein
MTFPPGALEVRVFRRQFTADEPIYNCEKSIYSFWQRAKR